MLQLQLHIFFLLPLLALLILSTLVVALSFPRICSAARHHHTQSLSLSMAQVVVEPTKALDFFRLVGKLKTTKRTGWVNNEVMLPESIADHMYRMSMLAMMITDPTIDKDRLIKICLVHDLGESIVGKLHNPTLSII